MKNLDSQIKKLMRGKESALEKIYAETHRAFFSQALAILKERGLAAVAVKDAYVAIARNLEYYVFGGHAFAWMYAVARQCAVNVANGRRGSDYERDLGNTVIQSDIESRETRAFVAQIVRMLEESEREIVFLRAYARLKFDEIGSILNLPTEMVQYTYVRAMASLHEVSV